MKTIAGLEEYSAINEIVHNSVKGMTSSEIRVRCNTLDNIVAEYSLIPGFVKIDVEGAEMLVLKGAETILTEYKPVIMSELCDDMLKEFNASSEAVVSYLRTFGYRIKNINNPRR